MVNFRYLARVLLYGCLLVTSPKAYVGPGKNAHSWYAAPERGWLWYKRVLPQRPKEGKKVAPTQENQPTPGAFSEGCYPYSAQMEKVRKTFDELQSKAILEPTLENVQRMQHAQNIIMDRSTAFEKVWMLASLVSGENFRESDQPSPMHRKIYKEQSERQLDQQIHKYAQTFGLFFIFKQDCPWCHKFAPVVRQFADTFGFEVKAVSPDASVPDEGRDTSRASASGTDSSGALELFPDAILDNGTIGQINPEGIFPCLFLVNPYSRQVIPLSRGLVNLSELRENFKVIIQSIGTQHHGPKFKS